MRRKALARRAKTQTEANDKVWDSSRKTEKALDTLAILCARFEKVSRDFGGCRTKKSSTRSSWRCRMPWEKPRRFRGLQRSLQKQVHGSLGPPGFHTTARELQTCTFQGSGLQKHQQNSTKGPQERERRMKIVAGKGRKRAKFWAVRRRVVQRRVVRRRGVQRRIVQRGGVHRRGGPAEGSIGNGCRVRGFGFSSGFSGRKQKQNKNKMKREMS